MSVINLGTYVYGDTGTDTTIVLATEAGDPYDLSGASGIALVFRSASHDEGEVAAAIIGDAADGNLLIEDLANAFTPTTTRPRLHFLGHIRWTQGGETFFSRDQVRFAIELFP